MDAFEQINSILHICTKCDYLFSKNVNKFSKIGSIKFIFILLAITIITNNIKAILNGEPLNTQTNGKLLIDINGNQYNGATN